MLKYSTTPQANPIVIMESMMRYLPADKIGSAKRALDQLKSSTYSTDTNTLVEEIVEPKSKKVKKRGGDQDIEDRKVLLILI